MDIDYYVGGIVLFPYNFVPTGWLPCDGQVVNISQYQALFSLIGITYGGNGTTTFALPNLNGVSYQPSADPILGMKYFIAVNGLYPTRD